MGRRSPRPRPRRLSEKLYLIRTALGFSQEQMAEALSDKDSPVHGGNISRFERDEREPSLLVILRYAQLAGITTDILIDDSLDLPKRLPAGSRRRKG